MSGLIVLFFVVLVLIPMMRGTGYVPTRADRKRMAEDEARMAEQSRQRGIVYAALIAKCDANRPEAKRLMAKNGGLVCESCLRTYPALNIMSMAPDGARVCFDCKPAWSYTVGIVG